jgi:hypothetical protein
LSSGKLKVMSKQKGFAPILIIFGIILILGISAGAYYFWKLNCCPQSQSQITSQTQVPVSSSAGPDEITNWKTFTNSNYKFEINYPSDWSAIDCSSNGQSVYFSSKTYNCQRAIPDIANITIRVNTGDHTQQYITDRKSLGDITLKSITVDGIQGTDLTLTPNSSVKNESLSNQRREIYLFKNNQSYSISLFVFNDFSSENQTFNQILSTFKFTN